MSGTPEQPRQEVREINARFTPAPSSWMVMRVPQCIAVVIESANGQFGFLIDRPTAIAVRDQLSDAARGIVIADGAVSG